MDFHQYFGKKNTGTNDGTNTTEQRPTPGTILVTELMDDVTERELQQLFETFGSIRQVKIPRERAGPVSKKPTETGVREKVEWVGKGIAYITFWDKDDALDALDYDGLLFQHGRIHVKKSRTR